MCVDSVLSFYYPPHRENSLPLAVWLVTLQSPRITQPGKSKYESSYYMQCHIINELIYNANLYYMQKQSINVDRRISK